MYLWNLMPQVAMLRTKLPRTSWFRAGYLMDCTRLMSLQSQLSLHIALSPLLLLFQPPLLTYPIMYIQCLLLLLMMFPVLPILVPANQPHVKPLRLPQMIMLQKLLFLLKTTPQRSLIPIRGEPNKPKRAFHRLSQINK